jgi:hypothetical protein
MPTRAPRPRAILAAVLAGLLLFAAARPAAAQEKKKNHLVVRFVAYQDDGRYRYQGKPLMVLAVESLDGRQAELLVPNRDMSKNDRIDPLPRVLDTVRALKKGDPIRIELDESKPRPYVVDVRPYKLKPGETDPKAYVFENSYRKEEGRSSYTAVVLSRFDEHTTYAVQQKRDKDGDMSSDPAIIELLPKLKTGDVVEAEIRPGGPTPVLTGLERYAMPQNGKFVKMTEQEVEGQKAPAVELEREGKPVTAVVVGKLQGKRWVPDARVLAAVRKLKADAEVVFRARDDGGKLWLKEIEPAPKAAEESTRDRGSRATAARESNSRTDRRGAKDAGERPARGEK